jgi:hypothetical protein
MAIVAQLFRVSVVLLSYIATVFAFPVCTHDDNSSIILARFKAFFPLPYLCSYAHTFMLQLCCEDHGQN